MEVRVIFLYDVKGYDWYWRADLLNNPLELLLLRGEIVLSINLFSFILYTLVYCFVYFFIFSSRRLGVYSIKRLVSYMKQTF